MRMPLAVVILLAILAVHPPGGVAAQPLPCSAPSCTVAVARVISTNDWGVTLMNDTITLNSTSPVTAVSIGLSLPIVKSLKQMKASDGEGTAIQSVALPANETGNYQLFQFTFAPKTGVYRFIASSVFSGLLSFNPSTSQYTFRFGAFPVIDQTVNMTKAEVTVNTGDWPSPRVSPGNTTVTGSKFTATLQPVKPFNATTNSITFSSTGTNQNIFEVSATRSITISQSGALAVSDAYNVTNRGKKVQTITFSLPLGANSVVGSDLIGELGNTQLVFSTNRTLVTFTPRFTTVDTNGSATLVLQYTLSSGPYLSTTALGKYTLSFQMFNKVKFAQATFVTKIVLPTGFRKGSLPAQTVPASGNRIILQASPVNPLTDLSFSLTFQLDPFWAGYSPLWWVSLAEGALAAVAIVVASGTRGMAMGAAPPQVIVRFSDLYDERSSLRLEAERMEEDLGRGAISRNDYRRRRRVMDLRVSEIDRLLGPVKELLGGSQPRYLDLLKRVERAEAELQVVRSGLADLKNQYRGGRISKDLYESLLSDHQRRKQRAQQIIDSIIIGLREEAR